MCLLGASLLAGDSPGAKKLYQAGREAERSGDVVRAYLLYSRAAALDPHHREYWARSQVLRTQAALKAKPMPAAAKVEEPSPTVSPADSDKEAPAGLGTSVTDKDLEEIRRLRPPPDLKPTAGRKDIRLKAEPRKLFGQVAKMWGLDSVFDGDYPASAPPQRFELEDTSFTTAIRALEAATGSFIVPLSEKLFLVAKDTQQKRGDLEPTIAVAIPLLDTVDPQEMQELARAVQQSLDIVKFAVDTTRRIALIKDRASKVRPAQALFEQLACGSPQVSIELQFLEVNRSSFYSYGLLLPTQFPITWIVENATKGGLVSLAKVAAGHHLLGMGIADAQMFARMNESHARSLLDATVRSSDGHAASFHVGDKYPIVTGALLSSGVSGIPPSFNFEDLGLLLKVIPHVHGREEVSLEIAAEFKVLAGSAVNGIPVISNRKFESKVRLKFGEWAMIAGLMNTTEARNISGLAGLATLPLIGNLFSQRDRDRSSTEVVLMIKPRLETLPPSEFVTREFWVGTESRWRIPL